MLNNVNKQNQQQISKCAAVPAEQEVVKYDVKLELMQVSVNKYVCWIMAAPASQEDMLLYELRNKMKISRVTK